MKREAALPRKTSWLLILLLVAGLSACRQLPFRKKGPATMREVPAAKLAYKFQPDANPPANAIPKENAAPLPAVQNDFTANRNEQLLARTVSSPDGQRALAVYATAEEQNNEYRLDMYAADGKFIRNITPPALSVIFPERVEWSADSQRIAFIGRRNSSKSANDADAAPTPASVEGEPTPVAPEPGMTPPGPAQSSGPVFAPVPTFATEQIYVSDRDGFNIKPLTNRENLIYFYLEWAPDGHALAALACSEAEWNAREAAGRIPQGRPRLLSPEGRETPLSDALAEATPVWSPDSAKVAVGFDTEVEIYDAATAAPTRARLSVREQLWQSSLAFDQKTFNQPPNNGPAPASNAPPASYQPIVRLIWPEAGALYAQTAFVRTYANGPVNNFPRWHLFALSPQAGAFK
jgi:hypothetical protein